MGKHTSEMKMVSTDKLIPYVNNARTSFEKYEIPVFIDEKKDVNHNILMK